MSSYYMVTYSPKGNDDMRDHESFSDLAKAEHFAATQVVGGAKKVFLDTFNEDNDLINFKQYA